MSDRAPLPRVRHPVPGSHEPPPSKPPRESEDAGRSAIPPEHRDVPEPRQFIDNEGAQSSLARAAGLRLPEYPKDAGRAQRAEILEQHIWATATVRGELSALRLGAHVTLKEAKRAWNAIEGWEHYKRRSGDRTKDAERAAKAQMRPDLADMIEDAEFTIARCSEEMARMDRDYDSASRAYTILSSS